MTFYDIFVELCKKHGTTPTAVCKELGFSNSVSTYWKKSKNPPKREFLDKIAQRFGISSDFLLGKESETPLEPLALKASKNQWIYILERMSDENLVKLRDYAFLLLMSQDQAGKGDQESPK